MKFPSKLVGTLAVIYQFLPFPSNATTFAQNTYLTYIPYIVGGTIIVTGILGVIAGVSAKKPAAIIFLIGLLLIFVIDVVAIVLGFVFGDQLIQEICIANNLDSANCAVAKSGLFITLGTVLGFEILFCVS